MIKIALTKVIAWGHWMCLQSPQEKWRYKIALLCAVFAHQRD